MSIFHNFMFRRFSLDAWLLLAILLIAAILRLYNFSNLSLGNDELSVLARIQFDSFGELIAEGVMPDVHPAGIQVFAYYWTKLFGESAFSLRFPFLVAGMISIFLAFEIGKRWFGAEAGLFTAAALASLQYATTLTIYARPYALVLCFSLAMVLAWYKLVFEKGGGKAQIAYVLFASLCMYFHYYSFLLVGIVALSGFFFLAKSNLLTYVWSLLAIAALYFPHIGIFFHHLDMGGSAWMGKPDMDYLLSYLGYAFHFSPLLILFLLLVFLLGLYKFYRKKEQVGPENRNRWLAALFFAFPFLTGYLYSIWQAPVMHPGGLFFSFPFFLLCIFSFLCPLRKKIKIGGLVMFLALAIFSLIFNREHFRLFYNRSAEQIIKEMKKHEADVGKGNTLNLLQFHDPYYANYYLNEDTLNIAAYNLDGISQTSTLKKFLQNRGEKYVSLGWLSRPLPSSFIPILREYYPYLLQRNNYFISEHYIFSKIPQSSEVPIFQSTADFDSPNADWISWENYKQDTMVWKGAFSGFINEKQKFGPTLQIDLQELNVKEYHELWLSAKIKVDEPTEDLQLVVQIEQNDHEDIWKSSRLHAFKDPGDDWQTIHYFIRFQHLNLDAGSHKLKAYLWNPEGIGIWFDDLQIRIEKGNPDLYGLVEPLY